MIPEYLQTAPIDMHPTVILIDTTNTLDVLVQDFANRSRVVYRMERNPDDLATIRFTRPDLASAENPTTETFSLGLAQLARHYFEGSIENEGKG